MKDKIMRKRIMKLRQGTLILIVLFMMSYLILSYLSLRGVF